MTPTSASQQPAAKAPPTDIYLVRERRVLHFGAPDDPRVDQRHNVWAGPGEYVNLSHPYLKQLASTQMHKLKRVEIVPKGAVFHDAPIEPHVLIRMTEFDKQGGKDEPKPITKEEITAATANTDDIPPVSKRKPKGGKPATTEETEA